MDLWIYLNLGLSFVNAVGLVLLADGVRKLAQASKGNSDAITELRRMS